MTSLGHPYLTGANLHVPGYFQSSDPGAIGAGKYWVDTSAGTGNWSLKVRNAANTGWETVSPASGFVNPMTTQDDLIVGGASGAATRLAKGTDGQVLTVDPTTHHLVWATPSAASSLIVAEIDGTPSGTPTTLQFPNGTVTDQGSGVYRYTPTSGASAALVKLDEQIVSGGAVASITCPATGSLSGAYRDLEIHITGRGSIVATSVGVSMRFNGDSGLNYGFEQTYDVNTSVGAAGTGAATSAGIGSLTAASAPTNTPGVTRLTIFDYARTQWFKSYLAESYNDRAAAASSQVLETYGGDWRSTAAITSITFFPTSGNFENGTVVTVYGRG